MPGRQSQTESRDSVCILLMRVWLPYSQSQPNLPAPLPEDCDASATMTVKGTAMVSKPNRNRVFRIGSIPLNGYAATMCRRVGYLPLGASNPPSLTPRGCWGGGIPAWRLATEAILGQLAGINCQGMPQCQALLGPGNWSRCSPSTMSVEKSSAAWPASNGRHDLRDRADAGCPVRRQCDFAARRPIACVRLLLWHL